MDNTRGRATSVGLTATLFSLFVSCCLISSSCTVNWSLSSSFFFPTTLSNLWLVSVSLRSSSCSSPNRCCPTITSSWLFLSCLRSALTCHTQIIINSFFDNASSSPPVRVSAVSVEAHLPAAVSWSTHDLVSSAVCSTVCSPCSLPLASSLSPTAYSGGHVWCGLVLIAVCP